MKKIHYFSALFLGTFVIGHIINHLMVVFSDQAHLNFMDAFRRVYRFLPVEILLYLSCYLQAISGFLLLRKKWKNAKEVWNKLQVFSGAYLLFFLIVHTSAILGGRFIFDYDTNLYFGAAVVNIYPFYFFYIPYYGLGVISIFVHLACVHRIKMIPYTSKNSATWQGVFIIALGIIISVLILNYMRGVQFPSDYLEKYPIN